MRELILHLGMNKTGSTTIQEALSALPDGPLRYPDLDGPDHSFPLVAAYMKGMPSQFGRMSPDRRETVRAEQHARVLAVLDADDRSVLLSSECLSIFRDRTEIEALLADARPRFDRIRALAYLREPVAYLTSTFQQAAKHNDVPDAPFERMYPRYRPRFQPWLDALGADAVELAAFDRAAFAEGDLLADFARRAGLPPGALPPAVPANAALSAEAVAVLLCLHRQDGGARGARQAALVEALHGFGETRLAFAPETMRAVVAPRRRDVAWAEARIGRPFPPAPVPQGPVWRDVAALRAYGESLAGPLRVWQQRAAPAARPAGDGVPDILRAVAAALAPRRGRPSLVRRLWGR